MKHKHLNSLDSFKLYYERLESEVPNNKKVSKAKPVVKVDKKLSTPTVTLKDRVGKVKSAVRSKIDNIKKGYALRKKKAKNATKTQKKLNRQAKIRGIIGIGLLFVVVSIAYSTYMTALFVDGTIMILALAPQVLFAAITLLIAFYKIYK